MEFPEDSPRAREDQEAEDWLRRELDFLRGAERRILRRARMREEAWRAAAVAFILAIFACCWYLAALGSESGRSACPPFGSTARAGVGAGRAVPAPTPGIAGAAHFSTAAKSAKGRPSAMGATGQKGATTGGTTASACHV